MNEEALYKKYMHRLRIAINMKALATSTIEEVKSANEFLSNCFYNKVVESGIIIIDNFKITSEEFIAISRLVPLNKTEEEKLLSNLRRYLVDSYLFSDEKFDKLVKQYLYNRKKYYYYNPVDKQ